jgi:hypothetical protein
MVETAGPVEPVGFITVEDEDGDLIVSFAIVLGAHGDVASLTLLRTPEDEAFLPPDERRVNVSHELHPETEDDSLIAVRLGSKRVWIKATSRRYLLDVSRVDADELSAARDVLRRMNFDGCFELSFGDE